MTVPLVHPTSRRTSSLELQLVDIILALPDRKAGEGECRALAKYLNAAIINADMNHRRPVSIKAGARTTRRELERLANHTEAVVQLLNGLHNESTETVEAAAQRQGTSLHNIRRALGHISRVFYQADVNSDGVTEPKKNTGDRYAQDVTHAAAEVFTSVTGRKATRTVNWDGGKAGGPFIAFLEAVFQLAGITSSPVYQAGRLRETMQESTK